MIGKVVICGLERAGNLVPELEIRQMIGRAGRSYEKDAVGKVVVLAKENNLKNADDYLYGEVPTVMSKLNDIEELGFHILPAIYSKDVYDDITAYEWYKRSLSYLQNIKFNYREMFDFLANLEMIKGDDKRFEITDLGRLSCKYYFSPIKIFAWKEKFEKLTLNGDWENDFAVAWALAVDVLGVNVNSELLDYVELNCGYGFEYDEKKAVALYYCMLAGYKPKELKYSIREYKKDIERIIKVLISLDKLYKWCIIDEIEILNIRIKYSMDYKSAKLAMELNIYNKAFLAKLVELNIYCFDDIKSNFDKIRNYGDKKLTEQIEEVLLESL